MRLALLSDVHANREALEATLRDTELRRVDGIVCLGDIVGYSADPAACVRLLRETGAICVAGNHDRAVCGLLPTDSFSLLAARAVAWARAQLAEEALAYLAALPAVAEIHGELLAVHGGLHEEGAWETVRLDTGEQVMLSLLALAAHPSGLRICACGHAHAAAVHAQHAKGLSRHRLDAVTLCEDSYYLFNPGSVGQPRGADWRASYMMLDLEDRTATIHRVGYDIAAARDKTRRVGLRPYLLRLPGPLRRGGHTTLRAIGLDRAVRERLLRLR